MSELTIVERVEHALRTERDRLRMAGNIRASNAINSYLQEADTDSKELLFKIISAAPFDVETPATGQAGEDEEPVVTTQVRVGWDKIVNAIIGAVEGGCGYWLHSFVPAKGSDKLALDIRRDEGIWYAEARFWVRGGHALLRYDNPTSGPQFAEKEIGKSEIISGLTVMANKCPARFAELVNENDDADTHDVMLQCILFGEIIFG